MGNLKQRLVLATLVAASICLRACTPDPGGDEQSVTAIFDQLRAGEIEAIVSRLSDQLRTQESRATLHQIRRDLIPAAPPVPARLVQWSISSDDNSRTFTATHEYAYADRILVATTTLKTVGSSAPIIEAFHVNVFHPSEAHRHRLTLQGKQPRHLAFLAALAFSVGLMIIALVGAIFTKSLRHRWLWIIISLVGGPIFLINWSTGEWQHQLAVGFVNTGVSHSALSVAPWILKFQIPVGAFVTLAKLLPLWIGRSNVRYR